MIKIDLKSLPKLEKKEFPTIKGTAKKKIQAKPIIAGGSVTSYVPVKAKDPTVDVTPIMNKYKDIKVGKIDLPMMGAGATIPSRLRTPEQKQADDLRQIKAMSNSKLARFAYGAGEGLHPLGHEKKTEVQKDIKTLIDNTTAGKAGKLTGQVGQFAIGYGLGAAPITAGLKGIQAFNKLGKLGQGIARSATTDLAVGLPLNANIAYNKEGLRGEDALKNIALNTGIDLVAGGALEVLGGVILKNGRKVATKSDFDALKPPEKTEVLTEIERLAYESNVRKGKITPQNDTLYGNSFRPTMGELPAPRVQQGRKGASVKPIEANAYHGSLKAKDIKEFKPSNSGELGGGLYFSKDKSYAEQYAVEGYGYPIGKDAGVIDLNIDKLNLKTITKQEWIDERSRFFDAEQALNGGAWNGDVFKRAEQKLNEKYMSEGYDGLYVDSEKQGVVFPEKINGVRKTSQIPPTRLQPKSVYANAVGQREVPRTITPNELSSPLDNFKQRLRAQDAPVQPRSEDLGVIAQPKITQAQKETRVADVLTDSSPSKRGLKEAAADTADLAYRKFVDSGSAVSKIAKATGDKRLYHYYNNARIAKRRAENMIGNSQTNISGETIGKSLKEIVDPIRKRGDGYYKDFQTYLLHEHNIDRMAQSKPVFGESVTAESSRVAADKLLAENPEFAELAQEIYAYNKNLMDYRVDSGLVTREQADMWNEMYPHYVPTFRNHTGSKGIITSKSTSQIAKTVKQAKGSDLDILPLHENMSRQTMQTVDAAHKNMFGNRLLDNIDESTTKYIQDVSENPNRFDIDAEELAKETDPEKLKNTFMVYRDGTPYSVKVDDSLYEGITALSNTKEPNAMVRGATKANTAFKQLITGWNPMFLVRNFARDIQDTGLYSKNLRKFAEKYPQAAKKMFENDADWQQYHALGGGGNSFFDYATGYKNDPSWLRKNTVDKVEELNQAIEQLPRFTEFLAAKGSGTYDELMDAMYAAADVTVNFGRNGTWGKTLNSTFVPFFNPAMQGADKLIRRFKDAKGVKGWTELALKATALGVAPSLINEMVYSNDPDYQIINDRDKDINYLFKIGDGEFVKIPKGRVLSMFGATAQRTYRASKGDENAYAGLIKTMSDQVAPINPLTSNIAAPLLAVGTNRSWFGGKIEPQRLEKFSPGQRYDESTTTLAKSLGGVTGYSPKKIDYLLDAYSGVIGDFGMPLMTPKAERNPFAKAFILDSVQSNKISQEFYDKLDEVKFAKNDTGDEKYSSTSRYMNKQANVISDLYNEIREVENSNYVNKYKKEKVREIKGIINGITQTTLDTLPQYEETIDVMSNRYSDPDVAYREANKEVFGAEYALKTYNKKVHEKAQKYKPAGVSYDDFYKVYFGTKDMESDKLKNGKSIENSLSKKKKAYIDATFPNASRDQKILLYEMAGVSKTIGHFRPRFK